MKVLITPEARKQYNHIPPSEQNKIKKKLLLLQQDPEAGKKLSGQLADLRSLKAWPYRIIYYVIANTVYIVSIAHRQGVYK